jgi:hypothetical protein
MTQIIPTPTPTRIVYCFTVDRYFS